jgi:hypothetical protein
MAHHSSTDYTTLTKVGVLSGLALLAFGAGGEIVGHALFDTLPSWENTLFVYAEGSGILIAFFSFFLFGVFLPLAE